MCAACRDTARVSLSLSEVCFVFVCAREEERGFLFLSMQREMCVCVCAVLQCYCERERERQKKIERGQLSKREASARESKQNKTHNARALLLGAAGERIGGGIVWC